MLYVENCYFFVICFIFLSIIIIIIIYQRHFPHLEMIQTRRAEPKGRALLMQIREGAACFREAEDAKHLGQGTKGKLSGCGS